MNCPKCGAANRDDARFCGVCGAASLTTEPTSPSLGDAPAMIGREIAGRYRMLAKLGEGGMGAVFRAEQISLKRTVAVKLLRPEVLGNQLLLRRFNAEAEAVAKLNHPNTVNIYDFGQDTDGTLFIAMEFIEGRSLRSVIQSEAPLPPRRALAIALQVAASLSDAHAHSIVHRDLKPDNVMLQDRGRERDVARVLDFGIAKLRDDNRATQMAMTQQGDMLGTPQYMAPEQIRAERIDGRTDVYALGCLLYEMVTARLPHEATTVLALLSKHLIEQPVPPSQRRPDLGLPPALDALILGAMAKDPGARAPTMEAFSEQMSALLAALPPDPRGAAHSGTGSAVGALPTVATGFSSATPPPGAPSQHGPPPQYAPYAPQAANVSPTPPSPYMPGPAGANERAPYQPVPPSAPYVPHGPPAHGPALHPGHAGSPPPSRKLVALVVAGMVVLGGGIAALVIADRARGSGPGPATGDAAVATADAAIREVPSKPGVDPWAGPSQPQPQPQPSTNDTWGKSSPPDGTKVAVAQGVEVIVPSSFRHGQQGDVMVAMDTRGVVIAAGAIVVDSDDPEELAKVHGRMNKLVFESWDKVVVGGVQRPVAIFRGKFAGANIRHFAVPLIGPGYRVAVTYQFPTKLASDPSVQALALELYTRRIVLP
jgi:serine/threonine protein kinase